MHYTTMIILILGSIILLMTYCMAIFYKINYLRYNLLRLDPLEESKITDKVLITNRNSPNIWLVGDSRIAHWNVNFFLNELDANVSNLGIDGQTSIQVLQRLKNHLEFEKPDWIILEVGINDLKVIGLNKGLLDKISESCYRNIISIINLCKKYSIQIICNNIYPNGKIEFIRNFVWDSAIYFEITKINEKLKRFCQLNNVEYFDAYKILLGKNFKVKKKFRNGFLHLNDTAYMILTKQLLTEFGDKLKSKGHN